MEQEHLKVVHLDDDPFELERVKSALEKHALACRFAVESFSTSDSFRKRLGQKPAPDVVILDIHIDSDEAGIRLAEFTRSASPRTVILMCSTADAVSTIAGCLQAGADDFISKQSDKGELSLRVYNSWKLAALKHGTGAPDKPADRSRSKAVGATMSRIAKRVPQIVDSAITAVFIKGESGTGKEVVADQFGSRLPSSTPFVKVNCGAIAPTLLESELFGHVKGAFTGAAADKKGLLEAASGGWIFLDEVATLSVSAQVALLRVIENQEVMRVGSTKAVPINVRVLSATNEPIEKLIKEGKFRGDLWQRLKEAVIELPPLRDRPDEVGGLIDYFCETMPGGPYQVSGPVRDILSAVSWAEGNIRELRNCLRAMTEFHSNKLLTPLAIPERIWDELGERPAEGDAAGVGIAKPADKSPAGASGREINIPWDMSEAKNYDYLSDLLLLEMTKILASVQGKMSLRSLAQAIGVSRSTLSGRFKAMIHKNVTDINELSKIVGITDK
jgi:DNA-binding NtrC family response regulator